MRYRTEIETHDSPFPKLLTFLKSIEPLARNRDQNMTQNWHGCAICCQLEVGGDVISGTNEKTIEDYVVVNFEAASSTSSLWDGTVEAVHIDDNIMWNAYASVLHKKWKIIKIIINAVAFRGGFILLADPDRIHALLHCF